MQTLPRQVYGLRWPRPALPCWAARVHLEAAGSAPSLSRARSVLALPRRDRPGREGRSRSSGAARRCVARWAHTSKPPVNSLSN